MSASNKNNTTLKNSEGTVEVLYQKLGDKWYAFSLVENEVYVGSISNEVAEIPNSHLPEISIEN